MGGAEIGGRSLCTGRSGSNDSDTTKDKKLRGESERGGGKNTLRFSLQKQAYSLSDMSKEQSPVKLSRYVLSPSALCAGRCAYSFQLFFFFFFN